MCGCDGHYVCPRCTGTPADPLYVDDEPRDDVRAAESVVVTDGPFGYEQSTVTFQ